MSSTSGDRVSSVEPHSAHASGVVSCTVTWPSGHSQSGSWWPHQIWREMFQSGASSRDEIAKRCCDSGWNVTRPERSASSAGCFSSSIEHHHCSEIRGSIRVLQRSHNETVCRYDSRFSSWSCSRSQARMRSSASAWVRPASSPASSFISPSGPITVSSGNSWSRPIS